MRGLLFFLIVFISFGSHKSMAQQSYTGRASPSFFENKFKARFTNSYYEKLDEFYKSGKIIPQDMSLLRNYYPMTSQYVAFSDEVLKKMTELSFTVKNSKDMDLVRNTIKEYNQLVRDHFGNLEVLLMAVAISRDDVRLGDSDFLKKASDALFETIDSSQNGLTLRNAIKVVTFGEEDIFLRKFAHGKLIKSNMYEQDGGFINVHQMQDLKTGDITKLYFDITIPIESTAKAQEEQNKLKRVYKY